MFKITVGLLLIVLGIGFLFFVGNTRQEAAQETGPDSLVCPGVRVSLNHIPAWKVDTARQALATESLENVAKQFGLTLLEVQSIVCP